MKLKIILIVIVLLAVGLAAYAYIWANQSPEPADNQEETQETPELSLAERMSRMFYEVELADTQELTEPPVITGNSAADEHIIAIATARGYRLQRVPAGESVLVDIEEVTAQPQAAQAWEELKKAAQKEGISFALVSGYRSVDLQRQIFLNTLDNQAIEKNGRPYTAKELASGAADELLNVVLSEYSIPGYSKHHSGYALDILDISSGKSFEEFAETPGYRWISTNDYANARKVGFLPSYPEGVDSQGPNPEPWEYVWVGVENTNKL